MVLHKKLSIEELGAIAWQGEFSQESSMLRFKRVKKNCPTSLFFPKGKKNPRKQLYSVNTAFFKQCSVDTQIRL